MAILHLTITNVSGLEETTETNPSFVLVSKNADFLLKEKDRREFVSNKKGIIYFFLILIYFIFLAC